VTIVWTARARRDAEAIHAYIAQDNPVRAHEVLVAIYEAVNRLADFPSLGRPGAKPHMRELVIPRLPYLVPYRVRGQTVQLVRILHTSRDR
jgi:toxin ParE1/3/4